MVCCRLAGAGSFCALLFLSLAWTGVLDAQVAPRIKGRPENSAVARIPGTTHPAVAVAARIGRAPANLPMERILMHFASTPEQEAALQQLLAEQQDPASPRYHAWLTPEQFGEQFGPARQDIDAIAAWLQSAGFRVTEVAAGRRAIEFSGTAELVERAFHTEIDEYEFQGARHFANAGDISIPEVLRPVVAGVVSLHNFAPRPLHHVAALADFSGGMHGLAPYDFAAIYNVSSLWSAGYDGAGQSIAIVGDSNIKVSDVTAFRALAGLPANNPTIIVNGKDPGIVSGEETEADLDVEWSGAVAKGANIKLVVSASSNTSDGITLSAQYIVSHAVAPVMSLSYGLCEPEMGGSNQFYGNLWEQAAAEGIAVFVAAGDSGSAGCDAPYSAAGNGSNATRPASGGFAVNGLASTPYNVAVGGTEFNDTASASTYWNTANATPLASAKGYIPEIAWNESSYTTAGASGNSLYAGGGGASAVWQRPSWQAAPGLPSGTMRLIPDVSLTAAGHDGYLIEQEGGLYLVGGTSAPTPSFAGLMAIINQYTKTANGNPNGKFYSLAAQAPSVYHDVTSGTNAVPCAGGSANCSVGAASTSIGKMNGYSAGTGYDLATGLGSVNFGALVASWGGTATGPGIVSLSPNPMTGSASSQNLTISGTGFTAGLKVTVGGVSYQPSSVSGTQVVVSVNVGTAAQTLAVQVTNPTGPASNQVSLTVNAPVVAPVISSLSPNPMTGSASSQNLTISGTGFAAGLKVTVGAVSYQPSSVSGTQVVVGVSVGTAAQTLAVQVTNPTGPASNQVSLTVNAPVVAPVISSLSPNPMIGSTSGQILTINGSGFLAGLKLLIGSTTILASQLTSLTATQLQVNIITGITTATYTVQVINANGGTSNSVRFQVNTPPLPVITSMNPNPLTGSTAAQTLTINGSNFQSGTGLKVTVGSASYTGSQVTFVSATQLKVTVTIAAGAKTLAVQVTNPSGAVSSTATLSVH